jgi:energy-coupling factor transport system permease protein
MVTWALENAIETADSMKSRGYGLPGRTAFSIFRFDSRDKKALCVIGGAGIYVLIGYFSGALNWHYFPSMKGTRATHYSISVLGAYFILGILPVAIELLEERKWKLLKSNI